MYVFPCVICSCVFSPFSIAITSLREERANLSAFLYVCSICACLDMSVSSSSWGLGRAAVCDCGTPWTFLVPFFLNTFAGNCHFCVILKNESCCYLVQNGVNLVNKELIFSVFSTEFVKFCFKFEENNEK